ncbi:MAG: hypothetical protein HY851_03865 [candidate division Zixibacteria bacterium]|nr:hypothetical protein [candidate division Zixibacteria bacterium]
MKRTMIFTVLFAVALIFVVGCERKVTNEITQTNGFTGADQCMTCHNDTDGRLLQAQGEWANSIHASGNNIDYTNRDFPSDCVKCHDHEGFVDWITTDTIHPPYENVSAIGCFTCHAPHTNGDFRLRADGPYTLANAVVFDHESGNLCVNCHHSRSNVVTEVVDNKSVSTRFGPHHGPQGEMIEGTGGYQYSGYTYTSSGHASSVRGACVGCHMGNQQAHDGYKIGGHSFNMVDEETGANLVKWCDDCHSKATSYDFIADTVIAVYDFDKNGTVEGYQTEFRGMLDSLARVLYARGLLTRTISGTDTTYSGKSSTVADKGIVGAIWNWSTLNEDRSEGIHNFKYAKDLIWSSINYVNTH